MIAQGTCKLFTIAENTDEYKKMNRTITNENKCGKINPQQVNNSLMDNFTKKLDNISSIHLIHDPSDIRKPYSEKTESLGKVRDLKGNIINGYSTHNIVAILPNDKSVHLVSHEAYSNKDPGFLKMKDIDKLEKGKDFDGKEKAQELYASGDYFNKKTITKSTLQNTSVNIKAQSPSLNIVHVLDREFDDNDYLHFIKEDLKDEFIIRSKKSRALPDVKDDNGKALMLINHDFSNKVEINIEKFQHKNKTYQNVVIHLKWDLYNGNNAVLITIKNRKGEDIFKDPMLLLTNIKIDNKDDAYRVYIGYLKRSKIEYVFRFLKDGLGWEEMQIGNFEGIKNLLSLCFYVSSYLYEIGDEMAYDDFAIVLADLGGGKGKVTRHFILKGIQCLISKFRADRIMEKHKVNRETLEDMKDVAGMTLCID